MVIQGFGQIGKMSILVKDLGEYKSYGNELFLRNILSKVWFFSNVPFRHVMSMKCVTTGP